MKKKSKIKIFYENKHLSEKLDNDEIIYAITVADVQETAKNRIGRKLTFDEVYQVRKGIEWGFFDWEDVVSESINNLTLNFEESKNV